MSAANSAIGGSGSSPLLVHSHHTTNTKKRASSAFQNNQRCRKIPRGAVITSLMCILLLIGFGTLKLSSILSFDSQDSGTRLSGFRPPSTSSGSGSINNEEEVFIDSTTDKKVPANQYHSGGGSSFSSPHATSALLVRRKSTPQCSSSSTSLPGSLVTSGHVSGSGVVAALPPIRHITWKSVDLPRLAQRVHNKWKAELPEVRSEIHTNEDCLEMADRFTAEREAARNEYLLSLYSLSTIKSKTSTDSTTNRSRHYHTNTSSQNSSLVTLSDECNYLPPKTSQRCFKTYTYPFSQVFRDYQLNVMRADVCRVLMVYFHGGVYMDIDVEYKNDFKKHLVQHQDWKNVDLLLGWENTGDKQVSNFIFGAAPRHPCMRSVLEEILRAGQDGVPFKRSNHAVHYTTGPNVLTDGISHCRIRGDYFINHPIFYRLDGNKMENSRKQEGCLSLDPSTSPSYEAATDDEVEDLMSNSSPITTTTPIIEVHVSTASKLPHVAAGTTTFVTRAAATTPSFDSDDNTLITTMSKTWWKPKVILSEDDLKGRVVHHHFGSNTWKNGDYGKDSWVEHRKHQMGKLIDGQRVDAIGRDPSKKAPPVTRIIDDDERYPTLIPKVRHVVELAQPQNDQDNVSSSSAPHWVWIRNRRGSKTLISANTAASIRRWEPHTSHFTTTVHDMHSCVDMGRAFSTNKEVKWGRNMSEDLCGLLAVYTLGGLYIGSHIQPKNIILMTSSTATSSSQSTTPSSSTNTSAATPPGVQMNATVLPFNSSTAAVAQQATERGVAGGGILEWDALPWTSSDLITVEIESTSRTTIRTDFIAARQSHECLRSAIHQLQFLDAPSNQSSPKNRPTDLDIKFTSGFFDCKLKPDFFPWKEWTIYFVNGYTLRQLRYDWTWKKTSGGTKPIQEHYVQDAIYGIFNPKASVRERALVWYLSPEYELLLPTTTTTAEMTNVTTTQQRFATILPNKSSEDQVSNSAASVGNSSN